jgi:hypothetical protein
MRLDLYSQYIAKSRYARYLPEEKRRENWDETVDRYVNFMVDHINNNHDYKLSDELVKEIRSTIRNLGVMPSMRSMMTAGKALERDNTAGYNCAYLPIDDQKAFDEAMHILSCFEASTLVKTKNGSIPISKLTIHDEVLSFNLDKNLYEYINPSNIIENDTSHKDKIELVFEDGSVVKCTVDHEFLTKNRGWVEAQNLTEEDDICNYNEYFFNNSKYTKWYFSIIEKAKKRNSDDLDYFENHHVIPKSLFESNDVVSLTAKEHFICHCLLVKMTEGKNKAKMYYALSALKNLNNPHQQRYTSRLYDFFKSEIIKQISNTHKNKNVTAETRLKMSESRKNTKVPFSVREKISKTSKNKKQKYYNNGLNEIRISENDVIPEGYFLGRLSNNVPDPGKGLRWYNDGTIDKRFVLNEAPDGWTLGRTKGINFGEKNGFYGKKHSQETKLRISNTKKKNLIGAV